MELETIIGRVYSVTSDAGCTVGFKGADGVVHQQKTVSADTETFFVAKSRLTVVSDDRAVVTVLPSGAAIGLSADGGLQFRVVDALPSEGKSGFVYLAPSASSESGDVFEEWLYVDGSWERFGHKIDLSQFPKEQLLAPSVGLDSLAAGPGAVAYCADSLAVGLGAVVGATYASKSKAATATRKSTDAASETNNTSNTYSSNSVAVGLHAQASGFRSTAYGNFATASGAESTASGYRSSASVSQAAAIGAYSKASGSNSTAIGELSSATGHYGASLGYNSKAVGQSSIAIGDSTQTIANYSIAIGCQSNASSHGSIAIGFQASSSPAYSTAIGARSSVGSRCTSSVAIGAGAYVNDNGVLALNAGGGSISYGGVGYSTQLYIITKGSSLSNTYLGGEAGLGYLVIDHVAGSIVSRGVIPLALICTDHASDFTPTGYDRIGNY